MELLKKVRLSPGPPWSEIEGARNYHLQIVYPDFTSPQVLLYDTLLTSDRFYPRYGKRECTEDVGGEQVG